MNAKMETGGLNYYFDLILVLLCIIRNTICMPMPCAERNNTKPAIYTHTPENKTRIFPYIPDQTIAIFDHKCPSHIYTPISTLPIACLLTKAIGEEDYSINNPTIATAPANHALAFTLPAPPCELGMLFVAAPPRYQLPISVNSPFCVNIAALGPTLLTLLLKLPKYEYLSMLSRRSKY
jgi:hypothetical protein